MTKELKKLGWWSALLALAFSTVVLPVRATAQDDEQDDPPTRVARLGYMEGSVSFQPAGEDDWVQAVPNRPMTTGDKLWADQDSRAELQLGTAVIRLSENTGVSFLNLDDHTVQVQLSSGAISVRVRRLGEDDDFEIDTPNLAFTISQPGRYRINASDDGSYTDVALRDGGGQATGNGQTYTLYGGQDGYFSGTDSLSADVEDIGGPDPFDDWAYGRDRRYDESRSAQYLSRDMVGFDDLDDSGDWRDDPAYGHVWFPHIEAGWTPYHTGHWDWIAPWGYSWVDDSPWGYAPFHYGRWVSVGGSWGWIAGPPNMAPVYAPALVVFIGGGPGGFGGNVGWFALGPREVYVPPYAVSRNYMTQVNISNTTVNTTVVTNVYNTTIINKSTTITNVTYANRSVQGAVTVVPQQAFAGAQPVAHAAVRVSAQEIASAPISARGAAVVPTRQAVLGAKASSAGHVAAPPAAVMNRQVVAKKTPPPPPVSFAKQQQALAAHPGQPIAPRQMQSLRPAAAARPMVKVAPAGKPATATTGHPPANAPRPAAGQPAGANRPPAAQPNRPAPPPPSNRPEANRPEANRPAPPTEHPAPAAPANRPVEPQSSKPAEPAHPEANRPAPPAEHPAPAPANRPPAAQPNRAEPSRPEAARPEAARPEAARPEAKPEAKPAPRPTPPPAEHPPTAAKPAPAPAHPPAKAQTPEEKKKQEEEKKKQEKPPGE